MNVELNYDAKSIAWINNYIEKLSTKEDLKNKDILMQLITAFSGECFIQNFGGKWLKQQTGIKLHVGSEAHDIFGLVRQQMNKQLGNNPSVFKLYESEVVREQQRKT